MYFAKQKNVPLSIFTFEQEAEEPCGGADIARQEESENGRYGEQYTEVGWREWAAHKWGGQSEGVERKVVERKHNAPQRGSGAERRGDPSTSRVYSSAEGGVPDGAPCGAPAASDVPPLTDLLAHLDSEEYLDTLHQLAESLLQEIDASSSGENENVSYTLKNCDSINILWVILIWGQALGNISRSKQENPI